MFVINNFENDLHSMDLLVKFCGEDIDYRYDRKTDTMYVDLNNTFDNCEELYENFLSDSRNLTFEENMLDSLREDVEWGNQDYDFSRHCGGC
jgi:hypothetical protein